MGWLTLNFRKLTLVSDVNHLEHRLTQISQEEQSTYSHAAYQERALGSQKSDAFKALEDEYSQKLTGLGTKYGGADVSSTDKLFSQLVNYNVDIQQAQLDYLAQKEEMNSIFTQKEQELQERINRKQSMLDSEQEEVETLLESARAEKEQMDQAISQDIKQSTISLV